MNIMVDILVLSVLVAAAADKLDVIMDLVIMGLVMELNLAPVMQLAILLKDLVMPIQMPLAMVLARILDYVNIFSQNGISFRPN